MHRYGLPRYGIPVRVKVYPVYWNPLKGQNALSLSVSLSLSHTKMATCEEDEFIVVRNERGKANIWRHFGFKKRKTDNTLSLCLSLLPICPWQRNKESSKPGVEVRLLTVAIDIEERESKSLQHCVLRYTGAKYRFWVKYRYGYPYRYPALQVTVKEPSATRDWMGVNEGRRGHWRAAQTQAVWPALYSIWVLR